MLKRTCDFEGCSEKHHGRGYCFYHWKQQRQGKPLTSREDMKRPSGSNLQRDEVGRKWCVRCRRWLAMESFTPHKTSIDGYQSWCSECAADYMLRRRYGMTRAEVEVMLAEQGGCAICGTADPTAHSNYRRGWHVDHDHSCCGPDRSCAKCVRGILCASCNKMIGLARDDVLLLQSAIRYLQP